MNTKRYFLSVVTGFIFIFIYEMVFHGNLIMPLYEATSELWRPEEAMKEYFPLSMTVQLLTTAVLAYIFTCNYEDKGIGEGARFGFMIGLFVAIGWFGMMAYMPIPITLAGAWFAGTLIELVGLGVVFAMTYRK